MMRHVALAAVAVFSISMSSSASPQQALAIPVTVKSMAKSPPKVGLLLQVSGYLVTTDKEPKLQDTDSERRIVLDFSKSQVTPESLGAGASKSPPVMIIGRMQGVRESGEAVVVVIGATSLTP